MSARREIGRVEVVGGGPATPEEVAAIVAALEPGSTRSAELLPVSAWRWSGRRWQRDETWRGAGR